MTAAELVSFIRRHKWGVVATTASSGAPEAAVVGISVTDDLHVVFDTLSDTHKAVNLRRDPRAAIVIGWDEAQTVQLQGIADEPTGSELDRLRDVYFTAFPDGPTRLAWPGITYFRVRPTWIRYSDFRPAPPAIVELSGPPFAWRGPESI